MKPLLVFLLALGCLLTTSVSSHAAGAPSPDAGFLAELSAAGVLAAAREMGDEMESVVVSMTETVGHPYRRYRWWIGRDEGDHPVIHAMPPEEEVGWSPWERWVMVDGNPSHQAWVFFPLEKPSAKGIPAWYQLKIETGLEALFLRPATSLEVQLRRARVDVAAGVLGLDFQKTFLDSLSPARQEIYRKFRWVVIPHSLGADQPVIYALPPMNRSNVWPWESWYTDGVIPRIHHVHYTAETPLAKTRWNESLGALQRPPEIAGVTWFWHDSASMIPALAQSATPETSKD